MHNQNCPAYGQHPIQKRFLLRKPFPQNHLTQNQVLQKSPPDTLLLRNPRVHHCAQYSCRNKWKKKKTKNNKSILSDYKHISDGPRLESSNILIPSVLLTASQWEREWGSKSDSKGIKLRFSQNMESKLTIMSQNQAFWFRISNHASHMKPSKNAASHAEKTLEQSPWRE